MSILSRVSILAALLLAVSQVAALASCQIVIEHDWSVIGPGGDYGIFQYQTGPGPFDAHTVLMLGPHHADIPAPLYAILAVCAVPGLSLLAFFLRGIISGELRATNESPEPTAAGLSGYGSATRFAVFWLRRRSVPGGRGSAPR